MNDLRDLLHDTVDGIEPADRIDELRARTASPVRAAARPCFWAAGANVVATAAVVGVVAVVSDGSDPIGPAHEGMHRPTEPTPTPGLFLVPVYYVGDRDSLFREFDPVPGPNNVVAALLRLQQPAADPDYTTSWTPGSLLGAVVHRDTVTVEISGDVTEIDALAAQQVVYTVQGTLGEQLPVRFVQGDTVVLGPLAADPAVLNRVSISDPAEGNEYAGSMIARGRVLSNQPAVPWRIVNEHAVVAQGAASVKGHQGGGFRPWEVSVDLSGLAPGTYTFTALASSEEGYGADPPTDTRTIVVR